MQKSTIPKPIFIIPDFTRSVSGTLYYSRGCDERHLVNVSQPLINDNVSVHQYQLNAGPESQIRLKIELQASQEINIF